MAPALPPKVERKEVQIFSKDEVTTILNYVYNHAVYRRYYPIILLAVMTGMRLGEILGLSWDNISLSKGELLVCQSLQATSNKIFIETPKTRAGTRRISLPQKVTDVMKELKSKSIINWEHLCFGTSKGKGISPGTIERAWKNILAQANVPYRNFHVLRHTHATELLAQGIPLLEVSRRLGHARVSHTLELYGHAMPQYDRSIAAKINDLYAID